MRILPARPLALLLLLAGCRGDATGPGRQTPPPPLRSGYIFGRDGTPQQVTFQVIGGRAVFEGDIDLGPADRIPTSRAALLRTRAAGPRTNSVITADATSNYKWGAPDGVGARVPYVIDPELTNPARVTDAMNAIHATVPAVVFVARTTEPDYVRFSPSTLSVCQSPVGRRGGEQRITLADGCDKGATMHEILHSLGFWHEQSRCDRDTYVRIQWENIDPQYVDAFRMHCANDGNAPYHDGFDLYEYDEGSIMHYERKAFSINRLPTIVSLRGRDAEMGQRIAMSATDASTLAAVYPVRRRICCR